MTPRFGRLVAGVVGYREGPRIATAIRSLLAQQLPPGVSWTRLWIVAPPDRLGTLEAARRVAAEDPRVTVIEETERRGKAAALADIASRADGDLLVLLNGDAEALPGAVAELLHEAEPLPEPFGVMARPVVPTPRSSLDRALELLWRLHDRFHRETYREGQPSHLSDELFALSVPKLPPFRSGIITDGAFAGAWIRRSGGALRYAERSLVRISLPASLSGHLEQRRRIRVGHRQVREQFGTAPETVGGLAFRRPDQMVRIVLEETARSPGGWRALVLLLGAEALAGLLSLRRAGPTRSEDALWRRVPLAPRGLPAEVATHESPG